MFEFAWTYSYYLLFFWNSNLTGHPVLLGGTSSNLLPIHYPYQGNKAWRILEIPLWQDRVIWLTLIFTSHLPSPPHQKRISFCFQPSFSGPAGDGNQWQYTLIHVTAMKVAAQVYSINNLVIPEAQRTKVTAEGKTSFHIKAKHASFLFIVLYISFHSKIKGQKSLQVT